MFPAHPWPRPFRPLAGRVLGMLLAACLPGCQSTGPAPKPKVFAPDDMPDICQDIDFNADASLREICGVKTRNYMAYRNIPEHRNLLLPKGGKIVQKGRLLELRLQNTLPAPLPDGFSGRIGFDEKVRRNFIKSRMDYCEFFPDEASHTVKIIKLDIPMDDGSENSVCYTVNTKPGTAQRNTGFASRLDPLDCMDFRKLKIAADTRKMAEEKPESGETRLLTPPDSVRQ